MRNYWKNILIAFLSGFAAMGGAFAQTDSEIKVLSYNINANRSTWNAGRGEAVIAKIDELDADLVGLQEAGSRHKLDIENALGDKYQLIEFDSSNPNANFDPVLVKRDRLIVETFGSEVVSPGCENDNLGRYVNWVLVHDNEADQDLFFYNNHLCTSRNVTGSGLTSKEAHAVLLSEMISAQADALSLPAIATGDFNARRNSSTMEFLLDQIPIDGNVNNVDLVAAWEAAHPGIQKPATTTRGRSAIDWILVNDSGQTTVVDAQVHNSNNEDDLSDHYPLTALIELD